MPPGGAISGWTWPFWRAGAREAARQVTPLLPLGPALLRDLQTRPWHSRSLPAFSMPPEELFRSLVRLMSSPALSGQPPRRW